MMTTVTKHGTCSTIDEVIQILSGVRGKKLSLLKIERHNDQRDGDWIDVQVMYYEDDKSGPSFVTTL